MSVLKPETLLNVLWTFGIRRASQPPDLAPSASNPAFHRRIRCRASRKANGARSGGNDCRQILGQTDSELMIRDSVAGARLPAAMQPTSGRTARAGTTPPGFAIAAP